MGEAQGMETFKAEFVAIESEQQCDAFVAKYGLVRRIEKDGRLDWSTYDLAFEHGIVVMTHRYWDPSGPFQNVPDENEVKIEWRDRAGAVIWSSTHRYTG